MSKNDKFVQILLYLICSLLAVLEQFKIFDQLPSFIDEVKIS